MKQTFSVLTLFFWYFITFLILILYINRVVIVGSDIGLDNLC